MSHEGDNEDELEIDLVLAMLEARKPSDRLHLANDTRYYSFSFALPIKTTPDPSTATRIKKLIASFAAQNKKEPKAEVPEVVCFSDSVEKLNKKRKAQSRVLLITSKAVYNIGNNYKDCKRRIPITKLSGITLTENGDDFVLHVNQVLQLPHKSHKSPTLQLYPTSLKSFLCSAT